jgi:hypothetical protein
MSTSNIIITVVILLLIIAGGAYFTGYFDQGAVVVEDVEGTE